MFSVSSEAKVGLFVLVGLIILGYMSFQVGKQSLGLKKGYTLDVVFDSAAGLDRDASVQIAGVEVGRVESIALKDGKALVRLRIAPNVKLEKDAIAAIKTHGILGDKYVELYPGTRGAAYLTSGEQISRTERQTDIDRMLNQFSLIADDIRGVTSSLNRVLAGQAGEEAITSILTNTQGSHAEPQQCHRQQRGRPPRRPGEHPPAHGESEPGRHPERREGRPGHGHPEDRLERDGKDLCRTERDHRRRQPGRRDPRAARQGQEPLRRN